MLLGDTMISLRSLIWFVLLISIVSATWYRRRPSNTLPEGAELGDNCTVSRPSRCGEKTLLERTETELTAADGFQG